MINDKLSMINDMMMINLLLPTQRNIFFVAGEVNFLYFFIRGKFLNVFYKHSHNNYRWTLNIKF